MLLDVGQTLFHDAVFNDQVFEFLPVRVAFYRLRDDAETVEMHLLVLRVLLVISVAEKKTTLPGTVPRCVQTHSPLRLSWFGQEASKFISTKNQMCRVHLNASFDGLLTIPTSL